jgi:hypothetical protein
MVSALPVLTVGIIIVLVGQNLIAFSHKNLEIFPNLLSTGAISVPWDWLLRISIYHKWI